MNAHRGRTAQPAAVAAVLLLVSVSAFPAQAAGSPGSEGATGSPHPQEVALLQWTDEIRVTNRTEPDYAPQVRVDANDVARFLWRSQTPTGEAYFVAEGDAAFGNVSGATYISNHTLRGPDGEVLVGSQASQDSNGDIHVVYDDGWANVKYMKYDDQGSVLVDEKNVGPRDSAMSRLPSLAVGNDDTVHIGHAEARFEPVDIAYDKLSNNGSDIWIDRVVTSDVPSTSVTAPNVAADRFNGNIVFVMGTDAGTFLGRFNKFGTKDMQSLKVRNETDFAVPDAASHWNGSIHLVWSAGGDLLYSEVNGSGSLVIDAVPLVANGNVTGTPRVRVSQGGKVLTVWEENVSGVHQIMYGEILPGGTLNQTATLQISHSAVGASQPWLAISRDDGPLVAWVDERDGNQEVYYRFGMTGDCQLSADPIELGGMYFLHPNETRVSTFHVRNEGFFLDDYVVWEEHVGGVGWDVTLEPTSISGLARGEVRDVNLTVHVPPTAKEGDNMSISVRLESVSGSCLDVISYPLFVQVSRELRLGGVWQRNGTNGETVSFPLVVSNKGDVWEDDVSLLQISGVGANWPLTLNRSNVSLAPGAWANFTVNISIPADAPGSVPGLFQVVARSDSDPTVRASIQLEVHVDPMFSMRLEADPAVQEVLPGQTAFFRINITNLGNLPDPVEVDISGPQGPTSFTGWLVGIDRNVVSLPRGETLSVGLRVFVPAGMPAGVRVDTRLFAHAPAFDVWANTTATTVVGFVCGLRLVPGPWDGVTPGGASTGTLHVVNQGNANITVTLSVTGLPESWRLSFRDGGSATNTTTLAYGEARAITLDLQVPLDALAGQYPLRVAGAAPGCPEDATLVNVTVPTAGEVQVTVDSHTVSQPPGGKASFRFHLANSRNAPASLAFEALDLYGLLPPFAPYWVRIDPRSGEAVELLTAGRLTLDPFGSADVELVLQVPDNTTSEGVQVPAHFDLPGGAPLDFDLDLVVLWPDLELSRVDGAFDSVTAGDRVEFSVAVENIGGRAGGSGFVAMAVDGQTVIQRTMDPIGPSTTATFNFSWVAAEGVHNITFHVQVTNGPEDLHHANESLNVRMDVHGSPPTGNPVGWPALVLLAMAAGGVAGLALALWRRRGPPGP